MSQITEDLERTIEEQRAEIARLRAELARLQAACIRQNDEICQTLGSALCYPRYCDSPDIFPNATPANGVCVGEHVAESLAAEAAERLKAVAGERDELMGLLVIPAIAPFEGKWFVTAAGFAGNPDMPIFWPTKEAAVAAVLEAAKVKTPGHPATPDEGGGA